MAIIRNVEVAREASLSRKWVFDAESPVYCDLLSGDVNGDGKNEIVFKGDNEEVFCLSTAGQKLWSASLGGTTDVEKLFLDKESIKIVCSSPILADVNGDAKNEIVIGSADGRLYCLSGEGKSLFSYRSAGPVLSTAVVADINADGKNEILFGSDDHCIYCLDSEGQRLWSFETELEVQSGIAVFDINGDGQLEVLFGSNDNKLYALSSQGDLLWKFQTTGPINAMPVIADIHNNGQIKIIVGSHDGFLYVLKNNGNLEWKYKTNGKIVSEASVADINFDKKMEIIVTSCSYEENLIILSNMRDKIGSYGAGFWVTSSTVIDDVDRDGNYEIIFGSYDHHVHVLTFKRDQLAYFSGELEQQVKIFNTSSLIVGTPCIVEDQDTLVVAATNQGRVIALKV